jgi:hypothetical protein
VSTKRILTRGTLICALLCLLGAALVILAIPQTVAAWTTRRVERTIGKLNRDVRPSRDELLECVRAGQKAIDWVASAPRWGDLGRCEFALAGAARSRSAALTWLARAEKHTRLGLLADGADAYAWVRLAAMRAARGAEAAAIVSPLMASLDVAPNTRPLWPFRTRLLLFYAPQMTPEELPVLRHQLRTIWTYGPSYRPHLLELAHTLYRLDVLTRALRDDPEAMAEFETMERNTRFP